MFIDIHAHAFWEPAPFPTNFATPEHLIEVYDELGIEKGVLYDDPGLPQPEHSSKAVFDTLKRRVPVSLNFRKKVKTVLFLFALKRR